MIFCLWHEIESYGPFNMSRILSDAKNGSFVHVAYCNTENISNSSNILCVHWGNSINLLFWNI